MLSQAKIRSTIIVFCSLLVLATSGSASAEAPSSAVSGVVNLVQEDRLAVGESRQGQLGVFEANELGDLGGAVLLAARANGDECQLELTIGQESHSVTLSDRISVAHVSLTGSGTSGWSIQATSCDVELDGLVLFVGTASAYVGENPTAYWASTTADRISKEGTKIAMATSTALSQRGELLDESTSAVLARHKE